MHVGVIGGGVIGLFTAYYLSQDGHSVTIIDQGDFTQGTSYGNAGMICPSHFIPLAAPGIIRQSLKWMFDSSSPFYIRPRLDVDFISWCYQFFQHASYSHVKNNIGPLAALLNWSRDLYRELDLQKLDMDLKGKGIIMACNTQHALDEEKALAQRAQALGIRTLILSRQELESHNPGVQIRALGGVHYIDDMHLNPHRLMASLIKALTQPHIYWHANTKVVDFEVKNYKINKAFTDHGDIEADAFVLAGGAWTGSLTKKLGHVIQLQGGKGYNVTIPQAQPQMSTPMILMEGRVAITPMGPSLRLGGTMELAGFNDLIRKNRVQGILRTIEEYLPDYKQKSLEQYTPWFGYRPLTPTGLPLIERVPKYTNAYINTGHGMLGLSLAPASGHLINQMISKISDR